jgi:hypothetical protein
MQHKDHVPLTSKPQAQQIPKQVDDLEQHIEHHQAPEGMDEATPEPCSLRPTSQPFETKKTNRRYKQQQQHPENTHESPETTKGKDFTDLESLLSDDSEDLQEPPRNTTPTTPKDKTTIADHKAIDILCDHLREQGNHPYRLTPFHTSSRPAEDRETPK